MKLKPKNLKETQEQENLPPKCQKIVKSKQIKHFLIKSMRNWLKPKLLEGPGMDTIDQLCSLTGQKIAVREISNGEEHFDNGFNEIAGEIPG